MEEKNYTGAVPQQQEGSIINAERVTEHADPAQAISLFEIARERLMDVNRWGEMSGGHAEFVLSDKQGNPLEEKAIKGLLIRIDIPGPGVTAGDGYDWVEIEEVQEYESGDFQSAAVRVRPTAAPNSGEKETAHFYSAKSTSTFTVTRENRTVTAAVYDRNLEENKESTGLIDKIRNVITGIVGKTVFSKIQWDLFCEGLVK